MVIKVEGVISFYRAQDWYFYGNGIIEGLDIGMDSEGGVVVFVRNCYIWVNILVIWYIFCFKVLFVRQIRSCLEVVYSGVIGQEVVFVEYCLGVDFIDVWY